MTQHSSLTLHRTGIGRVSKEARPVTWEAPAPRAAPSAPPLAWHLGDYTLYDHLRKRKNESFVLLTSRFRRAKPCRPRMQLQCAHALRLPPVSARVAVYCNDIAASTAAVRLPP